MALDLGPNVEDFDPLPTPHVRLYGSASDAGGRPLAKIAELVASRHNFIVVIELPRVQCGDSEVDVEISDLDEVIIEGQIAPGAIFADGPVLQNKRNRVQLCPTEPWAISFQFPEPVDWDTLWISFTSETVLEITVEKLSSSLATEATLVEAAGSSSVSDATDVDVKG